MCVLKSYIFSLSSNCGLVTDTWTDRQKAMHMNDGAVCTGSISFHLLTPICKVTKLYLFLLRTNLITMWVELRKKVPNVLSRCHTKRRMDGYILLLVWHRLFNFFWIFFSESFFFFEFLSRCLLVWQRLRTLGTFLIPRPMCDRYDIKGSGKLFFSSQLKMLGGGVVKRPFPPKKVSHNRT